MKTICTLAVALALGACVYDINDTRPRSIDRVASRTSDESHSCEYGTKVYRPTSDSKAPYDATIPPTNDAPTQVPYSCKRLKK